MDLAEVAGTSWIGVVPGTNVAVGMRRIGVVPETNRAVVMSWDGSGGNAVPTPVPSWVCEQSAVVRDAGC
jgi:hypothetical protein